jgi:ASC-1-like (ASCH) protein
MKTYTLKFKAVDVDNFNEIRDGIKTIETRAGSPAYQDITKGDKLVIVCGKKKLTKTVTKVHKFKSLGALLKKLPLKRIMPQVKSASEARKIWNSYTGYKERLKKYGIIAWEIK